MSCNGRVLTSVRVAQPKGVTDQAADDPAVSRTMTAWKLEWVSADA